MSESARHCASCGRPLDPPGRGGLCAVCLLSVALQADVGSETINGEAGTRRDAGTMTGRARDYDNRRVSVDLGMATFTAFVNVSVLLGPRW